MSENTEAGGLVERLRGIYRIPIADGLGAVGSGEEPDNPNEFVRKFDTPPIQHEAADAIEALFASLASERAAHAETKRERDEARQALEPFAEIAGETWADDNGWTNAACQKDRICDWFGPSAFRAARRVREGGETNG